MGWLERLQTLADVSIMEADRLLDNFNFTDSEKRRVRKYKALLRRANDVLVCTECGDKPRRRL